ncbi:MAG TPA: hypothetical protein VGZ22_03440 [Isosphaeraceae bacterium]|jgi:hypothetical protein|nr:hypothetical protein [Isosphaeraceae bacterium]
MDCAYCERPLICDACQSAYEPPTADDYTALASGDVVACPECGEVLVCHWCKVPYDGQTQDEVDKSETAGS